MRKKIIIIAVIAGLDLAFIFLMGGGLNLGEVTQVSQIAEHVPPSQPYFVLTPQSSAQMERDDTVEDSDEMHNAEARTSAANIKAKRPVSRKPEGVRSAQPQKSRFAAAEEPRAKFTDTIIWVNSSKTVRPDPIESDRVAQAEPASRDAVRIEPIKRSLFSRAVPIVKKPYDWIKELASKLK